MAKRFSTSRVFPQILVGVCLVGCGGKVGASADDVQRGNGLSPNSVNEFSPPVQTERAASAAARTPDSGFARAPASRTLDSATHVRGAHSTIHVESEPDQVRHLDGDSLTGDCSVFVDVADSALRPEEIAVLSAEQGLAFDESCAQPGFYLERRESGLYLLLCPAVCQEFLSDPSRPLELQVTYGLSRSRPSTK